MTLPEIPSAHREALVTAFLNRLDTAECPSCAEMANTAIATLLRLGYRVAPGLSDEARETILSLLQEATNSWHGPCADDGERAEAKEQRRKISAARAEIEALS